MKNTRPAFQDYRAGISCVDADYIQPGLACFYLLQHGGQCAVIETGTSHSLDNLERTLAEKGIADEQVRYVMPTHVHLDHAGGAGAMMARFPNAKLVVHPRGAAHLENPARLVQSSIAVYGEQEFRRLYGEIIPVAQERVLPAADGQVLDLAGRELEIRYTEGHARHHYCVWDEVSRGWFSGDMFGVSYAWCRFSGGDYVLPSTTPTQFDPQAYRASLDLLHSYAPRQLYLTHYGVLNYSARLAGLLQAQVDAYCERASQQPGETTEQLAQGLAELCADFAGAIDGAPKRERLLNLLSLDADLNAQGLKVWLQRQARLEQGP